MNINLPSLSGSKTYILSTVAVGVVVCGYFQLISQDTVKAVLELLFPGIAITLRQALAKTAQITQFNPNTVKTEVVNAINQGSLTIPSGKPVPKA